MPRVSHSNKPPRRPPVRQPLQARSRDTLERVLRATARLLESNSYRNVSITDIAREAGSSVGAVYGRFENKRALLAQLDARAASEVRRYHKEAANRPVRSTEHVVSDLVDFLVGFYRRHRGLMQALRVEVGSEASLPQTERALRALVQLVLTNRSGIAHPSPDQAAHLGFQMVIGALAERVLFAKAHPGAGPMPESLLAEELRLAFLAYLGVES